MVKKPDITRVARIILPLLVMVTVGYAGTTLLLQSHAAEIPSEPTAPSKVTASPPPPETMATSAQSACCKITVVSARQSTTDNKHINLTVTFQNTSSDTVLLSPGLQTVLTDTSGGAYSYTARYQPAGATIGGPLAPGSSTTLNLDFDMPAELLPQALSFQQDASSKAVLVGLPAWTQ